MWTHISGRCQGFSQIVTHAGLQERYSGRLLFDLLLFAEKIQVWYPKSIVYKSGTNKGEVYLQTLNCFRVFHPLALRETSNRKYIKIRLKIGLLLAESLMCGRSKTTVKKCHVFCIPPAHAQCICLSQV